MNRNVIMISTALVLMLTGFVSVANAKDNPGTSNKAETKELPWKAEFSGSSVGTQSDTNGDGNKGSFYSMGMKGTLGAGTVQGVGEFVFAGPGTCPNGNAGLTFTVLPGTGHSIYRFDRTGDLLFNEFSATVCFDPITTIQFYSWVDTITGGTGRFVGATGSLSGSGTAKNLFDDGAGNFLGALSSTGEGTIILMK
jgi:hypothetical protein